MNESVAVNIRPIIGQRETPFEVAENRRYTASRVPAIDGIRADANAKLKELRPKLERLERTWRELSDEIETARVEVNFLEGLVEEAGEWVV